MATTTTPNTYPGGTSISMPTTHSPPNDNDTVTLIEKQSLLLPSDRPRNSAESWRSVDDEVVVSTQRLTSRNFWLCAFVIFLDALIRVSGLLQALPLNEILEDNICAQLHLEEDAIPCGENNAVQAELATLRGYFGMISVIPGLLLAYPYNLMAEKYGRKLVIRLSCLGIILGHVFYDAVCWWPEVFPTRLVWLSPIFHIIGGGGTVVNSTIFSIMSDLLPDDLRSTGFFSLGAITLLFELMGSAVVPSMMQVNTWLPILLGLVLYIPVWICACCLPESLGIEERNQRSQAHSLLSSRDGVEDDDSFDDFEITDEKQRSSWPSPRKYGSHLSKSWSTFTFVLRHNSKLCALFFIFLVTVISSSAQENALQFARNRFGWSWSQTSWIVSLQTVLALGLLAGLLPILNYVLKAVLGLSPTEKDLSVARISCVTMLIGDLIIALASTDAIMLLGIAVCALGSGYTFVVRSLIAQQVEPQNRSVALTAASAMVTVGAAIGGPFFALLFRLGLSLSDGGPDIGDVRWMGLPFGVAAGLLAVTLLVLMRVHIR